MKALPHLQRWSVMSNRYQTGCKYRFQLCIKEHFTKISVVIFSSKQNILSKLSSAMGEHLCSDTRTSNIISIHVYNPHRMFAGRVTLPWFRNTVQYFPHICGKPMPLKMTQYDKFTNSWKFIELSAIPGWVLTPSRIFSYQLSWW